MSRYARASVPKADYQNDLDGWRATARYAELNVDAARVRRAIQDVEGALWARRGDHAATH
jgi:hypothetical protein